MRWTSELNDVLNQCVFECGYEFRDASCLLQSRARTLRLLPDHECTFTADECQVQWMAINPVEDDSDCEWRGDDEGDEGDEGDGEINEPQQMVTSGAIKTSGSFDDSEELLTGRSSRSLTEPEVDLQSDQDDDDSVDDALKTEDRLTTTAAATTAAAATDRESLSSSSLETDATYSLYERAPVLELSISEEELDLLISSLPASSPEDDSSDSSASDKNGDSAASEMQWVLSFLTNPDAAAHRDAEAKCLVQNATKHEDDNYQYFLQELDEANLLFCAADADDKVDAAHSQVGRFEEYAVGGGEARTAGQEALDASAVHALPQRSLHTEIREKQGDATDVPSCLLFDADPLGDDDDSDGDRDDDDGDDDWDSVRRSMKSQAAHRPAMPATYIERAGMRSSPPPAPIPRARSLAQGPLPGNTQHQLETLSKEIGDLMKMHGEFHFPKRLFPHHNDAPELEK